MTGDLNFWDYGVWSFVVMMGAIFLSLLLANALRRMIKPLRRTLIPCSVLAGFILLIADRIFIACTGSSMFTGVALEALTYHGLGLGVVAMTLRRTGKREKDRQRNRDVMNTGLVTVAGYVIQGIVGLIITLGLSYLIKSVFAPSGILLPMGYGQGPGQAYNWGHTYEANYGFTHGTSFGLSVAAMGFISASVGGVIYLNMLLRRKGRARVENAEEMENLTAESITDKGEIPISESMDKLTVQFALTFVCYLVAYGFMYLISILCDRAGGFLQNTVKPLLWGFNFLVGMLAAVGVKGLLSLLKKKNIVHREYLNNFMLNRISGLMFDMMVVASIAAIDLTAFRYPEFILPLVLICVAGAVVTFFMLKWICGKLFAGYSDEQFLGMYGMLTGTLSTGFILLREIDPLYETPAASNLIYQNLWACAFGFPVLLLMGYVATSMNLSVYITLGILIAFFAALLLFLFRGRLSKKKRAGK